MGCRRQKIRAGVGVREQIATLCERVLLCVRLAVVASVAASFSSQAVGQDRTVPAEPAVLARMKAMMMKFHEGVVAEGPFWKIPGSYAKGKKARLWKSE